MLIPDLAVGTDQGRKFVYVLNDKEQLDQRPVKLGPMIDGLRVVREGVQANDWIVVNGFMSIRPGLPIKAEKQAAHQLGCSRFAAMKFSHFFIDRPIFAAVLSIVIVIVGGLAVFKLPIAQYPDVVPPTVVVTARYPGANPKVIADTVATPIEQEVNGVEQHALHVRAMRERRHDDADRHVQARHGFG